MSATPGALAADGRFYPRREAFGHYVNDAVRPFVMSGAIRHVCRAVDAIGYEQGQYIVSTLGGAAIAATSW